VRWVEADRGNDRRDLVTEIPAHPQLDLGRPAAATDKVDLVLSQFGQQYVIEINKFPLSNTRITRAETVAFTDPAREVFPFPS
jgi:hypothetical protein